MLDHFISRLQNINTASGKMDIWYIWSVLKKTGIFPGRKFSQDKSKISKTKTVFCNTECRFYNFGYEAYKLTVFALLASLGVWTCRHGVNFNLCHHQLFFIPFSFQGSKWQQSREVVLSGCSEKGEVRGMQSRCELGVNAAAHLTNLLI